MLRVPVSKITSGMVLARPVALPTDPRRYLLQRGLEVPTALVPRLKQLGIHEVWIRYPALEFLEEVIDESLGEGQRQIYIQVRDNFQSTMRGTAAGLDIASFQTGITGLFDCLKRNRHSNVLLQKLDTFDNYLMSHSTNVCYLSMLLGMKLERYLIAERTSKSPRDAKDLTDLGLGALLHDVGKLRIPSEILNKPGKLTAEEMAVMQLHPTYGYEMVKKQITPSAAQVVLNHHQRYAGNGYPCRVDSRTGEQLPPMSGKQIPIFSRIVTLCDVYDAATTKRVYSEPKPSIQALYEMRTQCQGYFDPVVEKAFYEIVPPFPIGQVVTLSNGQEAAVVDFNPASPVRPKVQCLRNADGGDLVNPSAHEIDLAQHLDLSIDLINGKNVSMLVQALEGQMATAGTAN